MTKPLIVRPRAEIESLEAARWYEGERAGLGREFTEELSRTFSQIQHNPRLYALVQGRVRRALTSRFPYGVYYIDDETRISVIAILHLSRHPKTWKDRIP